MRLVWALMDALASILTASAMAEAVASSLWRSASASSQSMLPRAAQSSLNGLRPLLSLLLGYFGKIRPAYGGQHLTIDAQLCHPSLSWALSSTAFDVLHR